jgi:hypothetical protein
VPGGHTAYERLLGRLEAKGYRYREYATHTQAQCPAHDDHAPTLTIWRKPGRIRVRCWVGCNDEVDILPAVEMRLSDLWDEPRTRRTRYRIDPAIQARIEARRAMTPVRRAVDDLVHRPDLGARICQAIAWHQAEEARPDHWWWRAAMFHQAGRQDIALACLRKAAFLAYQAGEPLEDPEVVT